jgi:UDP-N-acetylglucosamine transferase subunit ALG13
VVLPFLVVGRLLGRQCHFIESAARSEGPSLSGKIATAVPGMCLYRQYHEWSDPRWKYVGSVFDGFEILPVTTPRARATKFLVTLGTIPRWQFRRLLDACIRVIPPGSEVVWQTGSTDVTGLGIEARPTMSGAELEEATRSADVVISHSGVGSALTTLRCGKRPILVVREHSHREHVDDHQRQIATELGARGLALVRSPEELSERDFEEVAQASVVVPHAPPPIELEPRPRPLSQIWRR